MGQKAQRTEEEKREAMDKIGGFTYQFYCFLYNLLTMKDGDRVWFEKWDDAAIENGKLFTLFQAKHTIKAGSDGEKYPLKNRSTDLWKALDVWRKVIIGSEEEKRTKEQMEVYLKQRNFIFISNKTPKDNKIYQLCSDINEGTGVEKVDQVLEEISNEQRKSSKSTEEVEKPKTRTVQMMIDDMRNFELRAELMKKIQFETKSQKEIEKECKKEITASAWFDDEDAEHVFDDFLLVAVKDFFEKADKGVALSYTFKERKEKFEKVFAYHRDKPLDFRIKKEKYKKEFLDLVCIQQLIKVKDFAASETDEVAKHASYFYSFKNRYADLIEHSRILPQEEEAFMGEAEDFWDNEFKNAYKKCDDLTPEKEIIDKAQEILYKVRQHRLELCKETLQQRISDGAFYYLSDECIIGWHRNWRDFFNKQTEQDGQAD